MATDSWARWLGGTGLAVGVLSLGVSGWQGCVAQRTLDRSSGRVRANVTLVSVAATTPRAKAGPEVLADPDDLVRYGWVATVRNVGEEPVEAVRLDVRQIASVVLLVIGKDESRLRPAHVTARQSSTDEYPLNAKLMPGDEMAVNISRALLEQMIEGQNPAFPDRVHRMKVEVSCFAKPAGGPSFDAAEKPAYSTFDVDWLPSGFTPEVARRKLDAMRMAPVTRPAKR